MTQVNSYLTASEFETKYTWTFRLNDTGTANTFYFDENVLAEKGFVFLYNYKPDSQYGKIGLDTIEGPLSDLLISDDSNGLVVPLVARMLKRFMIGVYTEAFTKGIYPSRSSTIPKAFNFPGTYIIKSYMLENVFNHYIKVTDGKFLFFLSNIFLNTNKFNLNLIKIHGQKRIAAIMKT